MGKLEFCKKTYDKKGDFPYMENLLFYACKLGSFKMLMKCAATSSAANVQRNPATVLT